MSDADTTPLDALSDEHRAILSLLLIRGRGYQEIAELLRIDPIRVRERAHAAVELLAPSQPQPPEPARARIADYLLGEQSVSERARTRTQLVESESERAWAAGVALALAPLAGDTLPAIPDPPADHDHASPPPSDPSPPADQTTAASASGPNPPPVVRRADRPAGRPKRSPRTLIAPLGLLAVVVGAVILVVVLAGGSIQPTDAGRTIRRLNLSPAGTDRTAAATAAIVRPPRGNLLLLVRGRGLAANQDNSYAVWLFNQPHDSRLLGFIAPRVGAAGTFSSRTSLPTDAARFHELIVTLETSSSPVVPGPAVLKSQLGLS